MNNKLIINFIILFHYNSYNKYYNIFILYIFQIKSIFFKMGIPCLPCSKQKKIKANQKSISQLPDQSFSNLGTPPIDNNQDNETYLKENDKILNDKKNEIINRERIVNKREEILFKKEKDITEKENE